MNIGWSKVHTKPKCEKMVVWIINPKKESLDNAKKWQRQNCGMKCKE